MTLKNSCAKRGTDALRSEIVITSANEEIRTVKEFISEQLGYVSLSDKERSNISFSVTEAVTNAIKHGNNYDVAKKVTISIEANEMIVRVAVRDEGAGFDIESVPDPTESDNLTNPSGRGVFFIKAMMSTVETVKDETGFTLVMTRRMNVKN